MVLSLMRVNYVQLRFEPPSLLPLGVLHIYGIYVPIRRDTIRASAPPHHKNGESRLGKPALPHQEP